MATVRRTNGSDRRANIVVWSAVLMVIVIGMVAFGVDVGYMMLTRTQLQAAVDSAALAAAQVMSQEPSQVIAKAQEYAGYHTAAGEQVQVDPADVQFGIWQSATRTFTPTAEGGNAIRVTARRTNAGLFFASVLGRSVFNAEASAVAMGNPRDIAFVIDLSGSMNDDTEPAWATTLINNRFGPEGYPTIGAELMQDLYDDFGFGSYPGALQYIGQPLPGVPKDKWAYAEMTKDTGPLTDRSLSNWYRISPSDDELTRKRKAYRWMIDFQIARLMPHAKPVPDSRLNYRYWEKYLDYVIIPVKVAPRKSTSEGGESKKERKEKGSGGRSGGGPGSPKPSLIGMLAPRHRCDDPVVVCRPHAWPPALPTRAAPRMQNALAMVESPTWSPALYAQLLLGAAEEQPPADRGPLPPQQNSDRIDQFNNPNRFTFPETQQRPLRNLAKDKRNYLGYLTYVQFMMDHGRDLTPVANTHVPLSTHSPDCPYHLESTAGGTFEFPPRAQPMHAARRALIAAIQVVKQRNESIANPSQRDWVSIISYDRLGPGRSNVATIVQPLTGDYDEAMAACTRLQAVGDKGASTSTESGLILARRHLSPSSQRGNGGWGNVGGGDGSINGDTRAGRRQTNKVIVLLTDGVPNLYESPDADVDAFMLNNPSNDFYGNGYYWLDAPLMQSMQISADGWQLFPVGVGLAADYGFMDRMARAGGTADQNGESPRGTGSPAAYEQRLIDIFTRIIDTPKVRLVD